MTICFNPSCPIGGMFPCLGHHDANILKMVLSGLLDWEVWQLDRGSDGVSGDESEGRNHLTASLLLPFGSYSFSPKLYAEYRRVDTSHKYENATSRTQCEK